MATRDDFTDVPGLLVSLCRQFYELGWVSGTGGGISMRADDGIWMAPSGVQKERLRVEDVFLLDSHELERAVVVRPSKDPGLRVSECQPLFYNAYRLRGAGAVIHSHSVWAVLAAALFAPDPRRGGTFRCRGLEMQKGLRGKGCFDEVVVPIIANTPREAELTDAMATAMSEHPDVDAVLVAGHGVYVWGRDWVEAKTQAECLDFLFRAVVELHRSGIAPVRKEQP